MTNTCSIEGCERPVRTRGWCGLHYMRWFKHGDPLTLKKGGRPHNRADGSCVIEGCDKPPPFTKGLCQMHYMRQYKYGDPLTVMQRGGGRPQLARQCQVEGCDGLRPYTRGLCRSHYGKLLRWGDPLYEPPVKAECAVDGCDRISFARTLCIMHYHRFMEHGDPGEAAPRKAPAGTGHVNGEGYHTVKVNGKRKPSHRMVMEEMIGRPLRSEETVHHINGVRTDNRPENLELWTGPHGKGQRKEDLIAFVVQHYRDDVIAELART